MKWHHSLSRAYWLWIRVKRYPQYARRLGADPESLAAWQERLAGLFPDVAPGDHIVGLYRPDGAHFLHNGRELGRIDDPRFARDFFAIWLDPRTSAPDLRAALLTPPGA